MKNITRRFDNRQYYMFYEDLRITALPEPSYENLRLTRFTCTMLKIPLHNCLIDHLDVEAFKP